MGSLDINISADAGATWTNIFNKSGDQGDQWNSEIVSLSSYAGASVVFEIIGTKGAGFTSDVAIDGFSIEETPSCFAPTGLTFSNVTADAADASWTDQNTPASSLFEVSIGSQGFAAGSGTQSFVNVANTSFSGLSSQTTYDVYVRANCGVNSDWSLVGSFTTPSYYVPTAFATSDVQSTYVDLTWTDGTNTGAS